MSEAPSVAGLVLTAGASRRMGRAKATVEIDGVPMLARVLRALKEGGCAPLFAVVAPPHEALAGAIADAEGAERVRNPDPNRGMLSSLREGLAALGERPEIDAVAIALVDHPHLRADTVRAVLDTYARTRALVVRPWITTAAGPRHGHPYVLARAAWGAVLDLGDVDGGMRTVLATLVDSTERIEVADPAILEDLDRMS